MADLKDSGERQSFDSGAVRDTGTGKSRVDLVPSWATLAYGWIMEAGARKYAARNWEKGMPVSRYIESAMRHLEAYRMGLRDEPHLWQAFWNIGGAIHTTILVYLEVYPSKFYDLPNHVSTNEIGPLGQFEMDRVDKLVGSRKFAYCTTVTANAAMTLRAIDDHELNKAEMKVVESQLNEAKQESPKKGIFSRKEK